MVIYKIHARSFNELELFENFALWYYHLKNYSKGKQQQFLLHR